MSLPQPSTSSKAKAAFDITRFGARGIVSATGASGPGLTVGSIGSGTAILTCSDASSFIVGDHVAVTGAGPAGVKFGAKINVIAGNVLTLDASASLTVSGVRVELDEAPAFLAALKAAVTFGQTFATRMGTVYLPSAPAGKCWNFATPARLPLAQAGGAGGDALHVAIKAERADGPIRCSTGPTFKVIEIVATTGMEWLTLSAKGLAFISSDFSHASHADCESALVLNNNAGTIICEEIELIGGWSKQQAIVCRGSQVTVKKIHEKGWVAGFDTGSSGAASYLHFDESGTFFVDGFYAYSEYNYQGLDDLGLSYCSISVNARTDNSFGPTSGRITNLGTQIRSGIAVYCYPTTGVARTANLEIDTFRVSNAVGMVQAAYVDNLTVRNGSFDSGGLVPILSLTDVSNSKLIDVVVPAGGVLPKVTADEACGSIYIENCPLDPNVGLPSTLAVHRPVHEGVVLDFGGDANYGSVYCGIFFPGNQTNIDPTVDLGPYMWEAWLMPRQSGSRYWVGDGSGGAHSLLLGFSQGVTGTKNYPAGNMLLSDASGIQTSCTIDGFWPGEWGHVRYVYRQDWGGTWRVEIYVNGICSAAVPVPGGLKRRSASRFEGAGGTLGIGIFNHNNFDGRIAMVRGFDSVLASPAILPIGQFDDGKAFIPEAIFDPRSSNISDSTETSSQLCMHLTAPSRTLVPDLSPTGYQGKFHSGQVNNGVTFSAPRPRYVSDITPPCGLELGLRIQPAINVVAVPSLPPGAKIFDSFNRIRVSYCWNPAPSLGQTDARASLGAKTWFTVNFTNNVLFGGYFGIDGEGRARPLSVYQCVALVQNNSATMDVRTTRIFQSDHGSDGSTGLVIRGTANDGQTFRGIQANVRGGYGQLYAYLAVPGNEYSIDGGATTGFALPNDTWTKLRATAGPTPEFPGDPATTLRFWVDDGGSGWLLVGTQTGQTTGQTGTWCGLYSSSGAGARDLTSRRTYDDFLVL